MIYFFLSIYEYFFGFYATSLMLSKISNPMLGNLIRSKYYKKSFISVGNNVHFSFGIVFSYKNISIGNNVRFGPYNNIANVSFGDNIIIAQNVSFLSGSNQHGYKRKDIPMIKQPGIIKSIQVGSDVWIGAGAIISESISKGSIVGSLSLVSKVFPEYAILGGIPAKILKYR